MRIGILTYHRSQNYGAQLQTYALQKFIKNQGHDVYIIDYWPEYHKNLYKNKYFNFNCFRKLKFINRFKYVASSIILSILSYIRRYRTNSFAEKKFHLCEFSSCMKYDIVIYGSDQIWRKQHTDICPGFNPIYFGEGYNGIKISYAASMGFVEVNSESDINFLRFSLSKYKAISVRENDLYDLISGIVKIPLHVVCDPVFLLNKDQWSPLIKSVNESPYILVYNIANIDDIDEYAKFIKSKTGYKIIEFKGYVDKFKKSSDIFYTADSSKFLSYLINAEYVVTSSFHGVALSLYFEKEFYFKSTEYLSNRTLFLLEKFNLLDRYIIDLKFFNCKNKINYAKTRIELSEYSNKSKLWLIDNINN